LDSNDSFATLAPKLLEFILHYPGSLGEVARLAMSAFPEPSGKGAGRVPRDLLPFPLSASAEEAIVQAWTASQSDAKFDKDGAVVWLQLLILGLNYGYGLGRVEYFRALPAGPVSAVQHEALKMLAKNVITFLEVHSGSIGDQDWKTMLAAKSVGYDGEEVHSAEMMTLEQIVAALPPKGVAASVEAADVATGFVRECLLDPELVLHPPAAEDGPLPSASIWADEVEWLAIVKELLALGIFVPVRLKEAYHHHGRPVLNGAFGVPKPKAKEILGSAGNLLKVLRLVMNLIPSNSLQETICGDMEQLPTCGQWAGLYLLCHEMLLITATDRKCFFYVFRLPEVWWPFSVFKDPVWGPLIGLGEEYFYFASTVCGMGWVSACGVCQHVHRNIVRASMQPSRPIVPPGIDGESLTLDAEFRRDRASPATNLGSHYSTWMVYIDDFDQQEVVAFLDGLAMLGTISRGLAEVRSAYQKAGTPGAEDKDLVRVDLAHRLGVVLDGRRGRRDAPPLFLLKLVSLTIWAIGEPAPTQKLMQVLAGRWNRPVQLRKASGSCFNDVWVWIARGPFGVPLPQRSINELLHNIMLLPVMFGELRAPWDAMVTVSDASLTGGAFCRSTGITGWGRQAADRNWSPWQRSSEELIVLAVHVGAGAFRRAFELCELQVAHFAACDAALESRRVLMAEWPGLDWYAAVSHIDISALCKIRHRCCRAKSVCLIFALRHAQVLDGAGQEAWEQLCALISRIQQQWPGLTLHLYIEACASLGESSLVAINEHLGFKPLRWCASAISHVRRPVLVWCSWPLIGSIGACWLLDRPLWKDILFEVDRGSKERWLESECAWEHPGFLPTFTRSIPRRKPSLKSVAHMDAETLARWKAASFALPAYQYRASAMITTKAGVLRPPSADEREVLLGLRLSSTTRAVTSSQAKHDPSGQEHVRKSLLGVTSQAETVAWLLSHLFVDKDWMSSLFDICASRASLYVEPSATSPSTVDWRIQKAGERLVSRFMLQSDPRGSDVKLATGVLTQARIWPRSAVPLHYWRFKPMLRTRWQRSGHINEMELRAAFMTWRWRTRRLGGLYNRFLHLLDSHVTIAVLAKQRSSSHILSRVVRRTSMLELAAARYPILGYTPSAENPADDGSRK